MNRKLLAITAFVALAFVPKTRADEKQQTIKAWPIRVHLRAEGRDLAVAWGSRKASDGAIDAFIEAAGNEKAEIVLLYSKTTLNATLERVAQACKAKKVASIAVFRGDEFGVGKANRALKHATGAWVFDPAEVERHVLEGIWPEHEVQVSRFGPPELGPTIYDVERELDNSVFDMVRAFPARAVIPDGSALLVRGRQMTALGEGTITLRLRNGGGRPARTIEITAKSPSDVTWFRRCVVGRLLSNEPFASMAAPFPPKVAPTPEVPNGSLVIVGGGGLPADVTKKFIDLAGGPDALVVVLPTAQPDPLKPDAEAGFLRKAGCKNVVVIPGRKLEDVEDPKNLELVAKAGGVWFGGGRQWRFVDAYENTKMHKAFFAVLNRGGVIGGSSAGATIQGDYLCRGSPLQQHRHHVRGLRARPRLFARRRHRPALRPAQALRRHDAADEDVPAAARHRPRRGDGHRGAGPRRGRDGQGRGALL